MTHVNPTFYSHYSVGSEECYLSPAPTTHYNELQQLTSHIRNEILANSEYQKQAEKILGPEDASKYLPLISNYGITIIDKKNNYHLIKLTTELKEKLNNIFNNQIMHTLKTPKTTQQQSYDEQIERDINDYLGKPNPSPNSTPQSPSFSSNPMAQNPYEQAKAEGKAKGAQDFEIMMNQLSLKQQSFSPQQPQSSVTGVANPSFSPPTKTPIIESLDAASSSQSTQQNTDPQIPQPKPSQPQSKLPTQPKRNCCYSCFSHKNPELLIDQEKIDLINKLRQSAQPQTTPPSPRINSQNTPRNPTPQTMPNQKKQTTNTSPTAAKSWVHGMWPWSSRL